MILAAYIEIADNASRRNCGLR